MMFSRVTHESFSAVIMSPASKSLLRSPDEKMCGQYDSACCKLYIIYPFISCQLPHEFIED